MNPYDFVRIDWDNPGRRGPALPADRLGGISGQLEGTITTLTPFFIPDKQQNNMYNPQGFLQKNTGQALIPGSSLKGLIRNLVETVSGGAWWFFGRNDQGSWTDRQAQGGQVDYSAYLPNHFKRPQSLNQLDAACRMFGFLGSNGRNGDVLLGRVSIDDGICEEPVTDQPMYTCILSSPKPRHRVWYLDEQNRRVVGRKFYFHSTELQKANGWLPRDATIETRQNQYIKPLSAGNTFTFRAQFTDLDEDDFALLLYALVLEPSMRHKMGYAKPAGLGSVHIQLHQIQILDYQARYQAGRGGITRYVCTDQEDTLTPFIDKYIQTYVRNTHSVTLQDLRRIWQWPAVHVQAYPSRYWFNDNPRTPISQT
ncbi:MAG: hypothetical protein HC828_08020 [Blastochloris sp.]|nr:hypothetical protein [Blastochloris sp.]